MSKALVTQKKGGALATSAAAPKKGLTFIRPEKLKIPRLKLAQDLSAEVKKLKKATPGDFINALTLKNYGKKVVIIPFKQTLTRIKWIPINEGGGQECCSRDGLVGKPYGKCLSCKFVNNWGVNKKGSTTPPECSDNDNYLFIIRGEGKPTLFSFTKSGQPAGQKLNSILSCLGPSDEIWDQAFALESTERTFNGNVCAVPSISVEGDSTDEERELCASFFQTFADKNDEIAEIVEDGDGEAETEPPVQAPPTRGAKVAKKGNRF